MADLMKERIRQVLADAGRLAIPVETIGDTDDLYAAGLSSHASVSVMLGLEDDFDVEFPDAMLTRAVFASIDAMADGLRQLTVDAA